MLLRMMLAVLSVWYIAQEQRPRFLLIIALVMVRLVLS